jgi:hypothetical protein
LTHGALTRFKLQLMYADPANLSDLVCRHIAICRYFGEVIDDKDSEVKKAYCDNMCDVSDLGCDARGRQVN